MAGFILGHLVDGIVDGVEVALFGHAGDAHLVLAGAAFSDHALVEVGLGIPNHVAQQFGELGTVLGLFKSIALEGLGDFGIALAIPSTRWPRMKPATAKALKDSINVILKNNLN